MRLKFTFLLPLLCSIGILNAQVCVGPRSSTTEANEANGGTLTWSPLTNAGASDNAYEVTGNIPSSGNTQRLKLAGFGFSLPVGAVISGIIVNVERSVSGGAVIGDFEVMLVKGGTTQTATNKAATGVAWPTTDAVATYGTSTDMWGNTWTAADINASNFGVAIAAERFITSGAPQNPNVDFVSITVCYSAVLPLKLKSFQTTSLPSSNKIKADWVTTEEHNLSHIQVEKSTDGVKFTSIATIKSKGEASENNYSYTDNTAFDGLNFYRLKFVDIDGKITYSEIKTTNITTKEKVAVHYANGSVNIKIEDKPGNHILQIVGADGSIVLNKTITTTEQKTFISLPVVLNKSQFYILKLATENTVVVKKIVVN